MILQRDPTRKIHPMTPTYAIGYLDMYDYGSSSSGPEFTSAEAALRHAHGVIDGFLMDAIKPGMSAAELYDQFMNFGEDVVIAARSGAPDLRFSGQAYARRRSQELCGPSSP
jgi:hypothetical protein